MEPDWSTMAKRLEWARRDAGFETAADAARAIGRRYPTYAGHENGSRGFLRNEAAYYASRFRVRLLWLITGQGSPKGAEDQVQTRFEALPPEGQAKLLDYLEMLEARRPGR